MEIILKQLESVFNSIQSLEIEAKVNNIQILSNVLQTLQKTYGDLKALNKEIEELEKDIAYYREREENKEAR